MIPDEALKAALEAVQNETYGASYSRDLVRISLTTAAPFLRAQALEDAAEYIEFWIKAGADDPISPDETRNWLTARAVTERGRE